METAFITYLDIHMACKGEMSNDPDIAATRETPAEGPCFEMSAVYIGGIDVTELLQGLPTWGVIEELAGEAYLDSKGDM
jgi:hypothetical protein